MSERVLVIGATGNIGATLVAALEAAGGYAVVPAARTGAEVSLDIGSEESIAGLAGRVGAPVAHVVVCCGGSQFGGINQFDSASWLANCNGKLLSVTRLVVMLLNNEGGCAGVLSDGGSIVVTAGQASRTVNKLWPGIATNNAALEAFVRNAGDDPGLTRGVRLNAVSPALVRETAEKAGLPTAGTVPAAEVAAAYLPLLAGTVSGVVADAGGQQVFTESHHDGMSDKPK